ncbi:MAG: lamin tail domain-containing protein [Candidatus Eisenbacteria bacterium]|nr:lamin tail domain-containing protein [Candidatus Eisenbacteria bacterium]
MHKFLMTSLAIVGLVFALAAPAVAQQIIGGHDETTENHKGAQWAAAAPATPSTGPVLAGAHLLLSEIGYRGLNSATCADSTEFVEIYNPTSEPVDLSNYYLSDVNTYYTLPVLGTIDIFLTGSDFAMRFPNGAIILPGAYKTIAVDGGRFKRCAGVDADFMFFNAGGPTTAIPMVDVARNKPAPYPTYGSYTNTAEFVWLFYWDQISDLVCDVDLVYWGSGSGSNWPVLKTTATCQDGPDADVVASCYNNDVGPLTQGFVVPASGAGTRQRVGAEGAETLVSGNGCIAGGPTAVENSTWGTIKAIYR